MTTKKERIEKARNSFFDESLADLVLANESKKYRPSNGAEGENFQELWCNLCSKDKEFRDHLAANKVGAVPSGCEILAATLCFNADQEEYPAEWTYTEKGQPCCTAFEQIT